uniref:Secreted protein n=1 Tax=Gongylonema pulchrum TaxID=637853 RepID=A0A183EJG1_9BILA
LPYCHVTDHCRKRKWLVISYDEKRLPRCETFMVRHDYLCTEDPNVQVRLRSRSQHGRTTYTITTRRYDGPEPVETRMQLNYREYISYKKMGDRSRVPINKERRCFMFGRQYYHLDTYTSPLPPSCGEKPLMLLETYTTAPVGNTEEPPLPDFMTIAGEVTGDPEYSMYTIAKLDSEKTNMNR